jgi:phospholipid/cholesterol/gamma-HCH transport system substrate-binding protein
VNDMPRGRWGPGLLLWMRRRGTVIANLAVLGVLFAGLYHVGFNILRLQIGRDPFTVSVELTTSGGLYPRSEVTYRGTVVGKVSDIRLRPGGVTVDLRLDENTNIPVDTDAVVTNLSPAGEQFIDLRPRTAAEPFLGPGSVIPQERTQTPVPTAKLIRDVAVLLDQVDTEALTTVVDELALALDGTGPALAKLIDRAEYLLDGLHSALPSTLNILSNAKINLDTANELTPEFKRFNASLRTLSAQLKSSDPTLRNLFGSGPGAVGDVNSFVTTLTSPVSALLGNLVVPGNLITARLPALNALLIAFPQATGALATTVRNGNFGVYLHLTNNAVCEYTDDRRLPIDPTRVPATLDRICRSKAPGVGARGAQNAPRKVPSGPAAARTPKQAPPAAPAPVSVATYDPAGGVIHLPDGTRLTLSFAGGGAAKAMGASWIDLLLGLLRS